MLSFDPEKVSLPIGHYIGGQHVSTQGARFCRKKGHLMAKSMPS